MWPFKNKEKVDETFRINLPKNYNMLSYNMILREIRDLGYDCGLQKENANDKICEWRRIRIYRDNSFVEFRVVNFDLCLSLDDYSDTIIKPIISMLKCKHKEFKMTREEASDKIRKYYSSIHEVSTILNTLETLGLITFDEPKEAYPEFINIPVSTSTHDTCVTVKTENVIELIKSFGYKVEKI